MTRREQRITRLAESIARHAGDWYALPEDSLEPGLSRYLAEKLTDEADDRTARLRLSLAPWTPQREEVVRGR